MQINCIELVSAANAVENEEKTTIYGETKGWPDLMCTHFPREKYGASWNISTLCFISASTN